MPGLVPGIHAFLCESEMHGRDKPGHDDVDASPRSVLGYHSPLTPLALIGPAHLAISAGM